MPEPLVGVYIIVSSVTSLSALIYLSMLCLLSMSYLGARSAVVANFWWLALGKKFSARLAPRGSAVCLRAMPRAPDGSGPSSTSQGSGDFSVRSMLAALRPQQLAAARPPCEATLSVYPGFELLTATVLNQTDAISPIGVENRQFLPEFFLLQSFLSHPCRVPHPQGARPPLGARDARQHGQSALDHSG